MNPSNFVLHVLALIFSILIYFPETTVAADAAWVGGDMKVDGLWFSGDPNKIIIRKPSDFSAPWTILDSDIYYLTGNVGIGTMAPATKLDVNGMIKATSFQGEGSALTNVTATAVINGAISDPQISGVISSGKLDLSGVQKKYGKVAVVAKTGGDYTDPENAMGSAGVWCGTPSATNPCLLKIMPGVYTITSAVIMKPYIDIEGSGERVTKLTSSLTYNGPDPRVATVLGADNAELRFLTIENTGSGGDYASAISNIHTSPSLLHVTASVTGGGITRYGIFNTSSSAMMLNVTASVTGAGTSNYGIFVDISSLTMSNVTASVSGATNNIAIQTVFSPSSMKYVTATASGGAVWNVGIYNMFSLSPTMTNVTATASGGTTNYGIYNEDRSSPTMTNVTAMGSGGTESFGVYNYLESSPKMTNVTATGLGGTKSYGVYNYMDSSPTMTNVTATGSGGTESYGVKNFINNRGTPTIKINHSVIAGTTATIFNGAGMTLFIGNSQLDGGIASNAGTITCVGVYSGTYTALTSSCQ